MGSSIYGLMQKCSADILFGDLCTVHLPCVRRGDRVLCGGSVSVGKVNRGITEQVIRKFPCLQSSTYIAQTHGYVQEMPMGARTRPLSSEGTYIATGRLNQDVSDAKAFATETS